MSSVFHSGERAIHSKLGVSSDADIVGRIIQPYMNKSFQSFIELQSMIVVGSSDLQGGLWSSFIYGEQGFIQVLDEKTIQINEVNDQHDVLLANLKSNPNVGILIID